MSAIKSTLQMIKECYDFRYLIYELVLRDIKVKYRRSILGLLWTMLVPIFTMLVMTMVFSQIFRFEIENYIVYLLCGNVLFAFFQDGTSRGLTSIVESGQLIKKVYIPKILFPISKVASSTVNLFFSIISLLIVMLITRTPFHLSMLLAVLDVIYIFLFTAGLGMILGSYTVFFRDIMHLFNVIVILWMYATPIFYPASLLSDHYPVILYLNPMYHYIDYFRQLVLFGTIPSLSENMICLSIGLVAFVLGLFAVSRNQDKYILYI